MSYLLDKKNQRKKILNFVLIIFVISFLFYFRLAIFSGLSFTLHIIVKPVFYFSNGIHSIVSSALGAFKFKNNILEENRNFLLKIQELENVILNQNVLADENMKLKETLGRKSARTNLLLSAVLSKPNRSPYDTLLIDVGEDHGVKTDDLVLALGNVPVGRVAISYANSSKVELFSNSGKTTEVVLSGRDVFLEMTGRGGGNFEIILPSDFTIVKGSSISLPGINSQVVAVVETVIFDPRDSFSHAILTSPANIQELKYVEVLKSQ